MSETGMKTNYIFIMKHHIAHIHALIHTRPRTHMYAHIRKGTGDVLWGTGPMADLEEGDDTNSEGDK